MIHLNGIFEGGKFLLIKANQTLIPYIAGRTTLEIYFSCVKNYFDSPLMGDFKRRTFQIYTFGALTYLGWKALYPHIPRHIRLIHQMAGIFLF